MFVLGLSVAEWAVEMGIDLVSSVLGLGNPQVLYFGVSEDRNLDRRCLG